MHAEAKKPLKLFYCYARKDKDLRDELDIHLASLKRQESITTWYDGEISAGTDWKAEIDTQLREAHLILLLVTPHFMASDYCYGIEMKRALERHEAGTARVIPILLKLTWGWEGTPIGSLQALPTDAKPVSQWHREEDAFYDIVTGINQVISELRILLRTEQEWFDEGNVLLNLKHYEDAIIAFDYIIHLNPNYVNAYHNKGLALRGLKRYEDALIAFDHTIRLDPNNATAYYNKGYALTNLERYEDALLAFDHTIRLDPNNATAYYNKGYALYELGHYEEAITAYDQAIRLDPNNATAYYNKGVVLENLGKQCYAKARQLGLNK